MKAGDIIFKRALPINAFLFVFSCIFIVLTLIDTASAVSSSEDKGRKEYWINKHGELDESPLTTRAHEVFDRVLAASDRRVGIKPELHIIKYDGRPWAQSLADGSIIISKNAIDFCYTNFPPEQGDSRFAFVAGHELAHQFNGDFWYYNFLRTAEDENSSTQAFQNIKDIAKDPDMLLAKELQADQYGIVYASLAGYRSDEIISKDKNFFIEWTEQETPSEDITKSLRKVLDKRAVAVSLRLKEVSERISLFELGLISNRIGRHDDALMLFKRFASYFPGREVYSNIGTIYLRMAYEKFLSSRNPASFPFVLSFGVDTESRARTFNVSRGFTEGKYLEYRKLLDIAFVNLNKAIEFDPYYDKAKNNIGCAYIIGNKYYDAISILEKALKLDPANASVQNNLAVAYILLSQNLESSNLIEKARNMLTIAKEKNHAAKSNWTALSSMLGEHDSSSLALSIIEEPSQDIEIINSPSSLIKSENKITNEGRFSIIEEISSGDSISFSVLMDENDKIVLLTMNDIVRLVLYKEPPELKISLKGNKNKGLYISDSGNKGVILSQNRLPDYFEF